MAGGYGAIKGGPEGLAARILDLQRQIEQIRLAAGVKSAILRGDRMEWQTDGGDTFLVVGKFDIVEGGSTHVNNGLAVYDPTTGRVIVLASRDEEESRNDVQFGDPADRLDDFLILADDIRFGSEVTGLSGAFHVDISGEFDVDAGSVQLNGAGAILQLQSDGDAILRGATNSDTLFLGNGVGGVTISSSSQTQINSDGNVDIDPTGELRFFIGTTTNPANLNQTSNNVRQVTSGRKYKADIHDAAIDPADVLALRPRTWIDKGELERDPAYSQRTVGFIAEELDEHDSLRQFVEYDEDGDPNAIYYDRMPAALVALAQAQQVEIDTLKQTVAALLARVEALEAAK